MTDTSLEKLNPFSRTVSELSDAGINELPWQFISGEHLIYSSPAALSFNSPGAEGFGVKRAALSIPDSVLLLVSPGCCGRNTSGIGDIPQYKNRFFFMNMDEADIVTGKHLKKVPDAVSNVVNEYLQRTGKKPSVVMICITCVDALLGTDMERVCRKAEEQVGLPVRPSYMYALTREGRKPPMIHVRQSLYSLLEKRRKRSTSVNLIGHFAPLIDDCELYDMLHNSIGVKSIRELSRCKSYDEFMLMAEANFNLVLDAEARPAAADMEKALGIPYIELKRLYQTDKIERQYLAFGQALGVTIDVSKAKAEALSAISAFRKALEEHGYLLSSGQPPVFAIGEFLNADPFELSLSLIHEGFAVSEIFGTITADNFIYIEKLAELSPDIRVYSNLDPGMIHYREKEHTKPDFVIGRDAAYYHPDAVRVQWREDIQPFGFAGVKKLYRELLSAFEASLSAVNTDNKSHCDAAAVSKVSAGNVFPDIMLSHSTSTENAYGAAAVSSSAACNISVNADGSDAEAFPDASCTLKHLRGYRSYLPPFAPDASGASSVLYSLGGIIVICDAGGCAGNICGFDEPRWLSEKSAIYSAGLRDMDAILGRDDRLVEKLKRTAESVGNVPFAAIIGTPVPAVIATDYHALKHMSERRTGLTTLSIDTSGMELYDTGASKAYLELFSEFTRNSELEDKDVKAKDEAAKTAYNGYTGILGANPIDMSSREIKSFFSDALSDNKICCFSMGDGLDAVHAAGNMTKNIVVAPSGIKAAEFIKRKFGVPYEISFPGAEHILKKAVNASGLFNTKDAEAKVAADTAFYECFDNKNVLIIHQDVLACALKELINEHSNAKVTTACWFKTVSDKTIKLHDEHDLSELIKKLKPDLVIGDMDMKPLCDSTGIEVSFIDLPHFAVSGRLMEELL